MNINTIKPTTQRRFDKTLSFLRKHHIQPNKRMLDLGIESPLTQYLKASGYQQIINTHGQDLDIDFDIVHNYDFITAFEIFEHLFAPFNILQAASGEMIASVPLKQWISPEAHWNENDPWDCHYHEFEPRQFDRLLERTGWRIVDSEKWPSYSFPLSPRRLLRVPRYYIVYAVKTQF